MAFDSECASEATATEFLKTFSMSSYCYRYGILLSKFRFPLTNFNEGAFVSGNSEELVFFLLGKDLSEN
ncbi:hypothetical protein VNO80_17909 [Phaseolus coccineus]|uniref:Uncharacterized protein n=1 Tax=Phaseolus coccineus TaxID=3886 RepID=A0AAN9QYE2_PHACN